MPRGTGPQTFKNTTKEELGDDLEVCPYNKSHMIRPERMQRHLILCRKDVLSKPNHPFHKAAKDLERCPYDANHHIPKAEMDNHILECPSKREMKPKVPTAVPSWRKSVVTDKSEAANNMVEENWDDAAEDDWDNPQPGYNPQAKILNSNKPILYNVPGLNKSEKREFRARQRARHIGGQQDAFEDWDQGQLVDGVNSMRVGGRGADRQDDW
eukprot:TRINITY_DN8095_c0_g1_i7.p1 TRINITY_DN8095_c0_g1~~TRINITY_DN8095_c0_g1_i7.p1  ORF type:complete len:212 (-),score=62.41 TRINITY_DN8095_c0_g1_i7:146-781(-)